MDKLKRFFWLCSGSDLALLNKAPTESSKFAGIGATIFFTGLFAAIAGSYALHTVFDNWVIASLIGLVWGLMIFNLDRYIVSSMKKSGRSGREFLLALPRAILAVLIALVISKPLELKIFEKEIEKELVLMEQVMYENQLKGVVNPLDTEIGILKTEIGALKNEIAVKEQKRDNLRRISQAEADGTGGSMRRNPGPIYRIKKADADRVEKELEDLAAKNQILIDQKIERISTLEARKNKAETSFERKPLDGLASRLDALDNLTDNSGAMSLTNWFIILLFIAIETTPIVVKLIASRGPYDELLSIEEHKITSKKIEEIAKINHNTKQRTKHLHEVDKAYVEKNLAATSG